MKKKIKLRKLTLDEEMYWSGAEDAEEGPALIAETIAINWPKDFGYEGNRVVIIVDLNGATINGNETWFNRELSYEKSKAEVEKLTIPIDASKLKAMGWKLERA